MGLIEKASNFLGGNSPKYVFYADIVYCSTDECESESDLIKAKEFGKNYLFHPFGIRESGKLDLLNGIPGNAQNILNVSIYLDRIASLISNRTSPGNIELPVFYKNFYRKGEITLSMDNSMSISKKSLDDLMEIYETHKTVSNPRV